MKPRLTAPVPRIALTLEESAAALGVSLAHLRRHILPGLRVIYSGAARLVPVAELEKWADREAILAGSTTLDVTEKRRGAAVTAPSMAHGEGTP